jgi:FkbM family methyltransferase
MKEQNPVEQYAEQIQAINELPIIGSGIDTEGDPFIRLQSGETFYGHTLLGEFQIDMYKKLDRTTKNVLDQECFQVAFDTVESYYSERINQQRYYDVSDGDFVVEVGSYCGYYTIKLAHDVGTDGVVVAIEADDNNYRLLRKNINENNIDNIVPVQQAVSETSTTDKFYYTTSQGNSLNRDIIENVESPVIGDELDSTTIQTDTLDSILSSVNISNESVDFAILTVNGAEMNVLRGMENTLESGIHLSIAAPYSDGTQPYHLKIKQFLRDREYNTKYEEDTVYGSPQNE